MRGPPLTTDTLRIVGREIRRNLPQIKGQCRTASQRFKSALDRDYNTPCDIREVRVGEARDTHFVNTLDTSYLADVDGSARVIVDTTLDQFCSENQGYPDINIDLGPQQWLPAVGIYPPGAEERTCWYYSPSVPVEGDDSEITF